MSLRQPSLSSGAFARLITNRPPLPEAQQLARATEAPRDCVRVFPGITGGTIELVGFDSAAIAQIKIEFAANRLTAEWEPWVLKWVRRFDEQYQRPRLIG